MTWVEYIILADVLGLIALFQLKVVLESRRWTFIVDIGTSACAEVQRWH